MKKLTVFLLVLGTVFLFPFCTYADEINKDEYNGYLDEYNAYELFDSLDNDTENILKELGIDNFDYENIMNLSLEKLFSIISKMIQSKLKAPLQGAASVLIFIIISSFFSSLKYDGSQSQLYSTFSSVVISIILIYRISDTVTLSAAALEIASDFVFSFIPILGVILITSGSGATSLSTNSMLLVLAQGLSFISSNFLMPCINCYLSIGICSSVREELHLERLLNGIKNIIIKLTSFLCGVFVSILSLKTTVASKADILGIRSVRFVINSVVPVIGSAISEGLLSIQSYSSLIKSSVGTVGIIAIALIFLPCVIQVVMWRLTFACCETVSEIFGNDSVSQTLRTFGNAMLMMNVILILSMVTTIISFGILIAAKTS